MSFSVDQFMQVKCKFQLTSETESSESLHSNNERVRLCTSVDLDKDSTLIVMICSNETGNNHIVAYYLERRFQTASISTDNGLPSNKLDAAADQKTPPRSSVTFSQLASIGSQSRQQNNSPRASGLIARTKPRVIVKQIYYHSYNEDIVAICLSETGHKLALVSASSTIYIIPIKNILLNLHAKQLRSSQGKSMYFYDASILDSCTLDNPIAVAYWESPESENKSCVIVASQEGEISFISVEEKKEVSRTCVNERVRRMRIIRDRFSYSLLITCDSYRQYRFSLELVKQQEQSPDKYQPTINSHHIYTDEYTYLEKDIMPSWDRKPVPIKLHSANLSNHRRGSVAAAAIQRVFVPSSRVGAQGGLFSKDRHSPLLFYHPPNMISVVDTLGTQKSLATNNRLQNSEPRLLRFFSNEQFYYRPQKPILVCKLTSLYPDEMITITVLTDRFLAIATDRERCLINSRNCCNLRDPDSTIKLDPIVKEIRFNNEEKIMLLLKSPVSNDRDGMIDSFLLVTNRSIYTIEARQSCRDMFINLIDTHLGFKPAASFSALRAGRRSYENFKSIIEQRKNSLTSFLCHRDEVYESISHDSRAFSMLFKLELNSLYEAYGDMLMLRSQFELANRFFQMAKFDHIKTMGKYIRLGGFLRNNSPEVDYLKFITSPEVNKVLVRDISLTCEFLGCQQNLIHFQKYSLAALHQFDAFRKLVTISQKQPTKPEHESKFMFNEQQKQSIEEIFIEFLNASLDDSTEDSCRLWFNYINFYLNHVGTVEELESDILDLLESGSSDYHLAITLYKAIDKDENGALKSIVTTDSNTPLEPMEKLYNLSGLFKNEFLMKLLEKSISSMYS